VSPIAVPKEVRDEVVRELYRQVGTMDWELMSPQSKNQQYARWIDDPDIGGRLTQFQSAEDARVWLKEGPMKEYARALDGVGLFAVFTTKRLSGPDELIRRALGEEWTIVPHSQAGKPLHCLATDGATTRYVCWGQPGKFRDLVWAAVNKAVDLPHRPMIVVSVRDGQDVNGEERRRHEQIAAHCGVDVKHVHRRLVDRDDM
jgi:hypothetical protein